MRGKAAVAAVLGLSALAGGVGAQGRAASEDDLAVVRKAVASPAPAGVQPRPKATPAVARVGAEPQWFKVRVVDKASGRRKVTVNLPLALVRAFGDETVDWGCRDDATPGHARARCHTLRLGDLLQTLEAGQSLVEVDDEEASVRVWVE